MRLRAAPDLHFQQDTALDYAMQIARALNQPEVARDLSRSQAEGRRGVSEHPGRSGGKPHGGKPGGQHARNRQRKPKGRPIDGWLIIDKPSGIGSTDVVTRLKRLFDAQKGGHGGTLDPLATGVLPIAFGAATKTVPYVMDGTKTYRFTLRFGDLRDTDDADGQTIGTSDVRPTDAEIEAALPAFRGDIMQVPPIFSAIKVAGERAYDLAREGQAVELAAPPRPGRPVRAGSTARRRSPPSSRCSAARASTCARLARDLARACGTVGHIAALRRMRVGPFHEATAIPLDKLRRAGRYAAPSPDLLLPVATALADIPALALTEAEAMRLMQARPSAWSSSWAGFRRADPDGGLVRAMAGDGSWGSAAWSPAC